MAYVTLDQLIRRFGAGQLQQLTDMDGAGVIDETRVTDAITAANELIDAHLGGRYQLPLSSVPGLLSSIAQDLVHARLHIHAVPEVVATADREARRLLRDIRDGDLALPLAGQVVRSSDGVAFNAGDRLFDRDQMRGW